MMRFKSFILITVYLFICIFNTHFIFAEMNHDISQLPNEYIIKFKEGSDFSNIIMPSNINSEKIYSNMKYLKAYDKISCDYIENELINDPRVEYIQQNHALHIMSVVNDLYHDQQWGLVNSGQSYSKKGFEGIDINFRKFIENFEFDSSKEIIVGLIDTAVDITHEDLKEIIYINEKEIIGNGIDDDSNGFTDDINGWDFLNNDNTVWDLASSDVHGTHLAGIIGAEFNEIGISGVFPKVKILPIKIMDHLQGADTVSAIKAIEYAKKMGVKIINCSWGSTVFDQALFDCMKDSGMLFVCAAGNIVKYSKITPMYPACFPLDNIISVASIDNCGILSDFTHIGENITLAAPGENIFSTLPNNKYGLKSGTSMATAFVTGVACAVYSHNSDQNILSVVDKIKNSVFQLESLENKVNTSGIVDMFSSVYSEVYSRPFQSDINIIESSQQYILQWDTDLDALSYELEIDRDRVSSVSQNVYKVDKLESNNIHIFRVRSIYSEDDNIEISRWSKAKIVGQVDKTEGTYPPTFTPTPTILHTPTPIAPKPTIPRQTSEVQKKDSIGNSSSRSSSGQTDKSSKDVSIPTAAPSIKPENSQAPLVSEEPLEKEIKLEIPEAIYKEIETHWAKNALLELLKKGIITGYEDDTIKPDKKITRAEMVVLLMKAKGIVPQLEVELDFVDVTEAPIWATGYIKEAVSLEIITGYPDHTVRANEEISRAEAIVMLMKSFNVEPSTDNLKYFEDYDYIPNWARGYLAMAYNNKIIMGYQDNTIRASNKITRAELITMLVKCLEKYGD